VSPESTWRASKPSADSTRSAETRADPARQFRQAATQRAALKELAATQRAPGPRRPRVGLFAVVVILAIAVGGGAAVWLDAVPDPWSTPEPEVAAIAPPRAAVPPPVPPPGRPVEIATVPPASVVQPEPAPPQPLVTKPAPSAAVALPPPEPPPQPPAAPEPPAAVVPMPTPPPVPPVQAPAAEIVLVPPPKAPVIEPIAPEPREPAPPVAAPPPPPAPARAEKPSPQPSPPEAQHAPPPPAPARPVARVAPPPAPTLEPKSPAPPVARTPSPVAPPAAASSAQPATVPAKAPPAPVESPEAKGLAIAREMDRREDGYADTAAKVRMVLRNQGGESSARDMRIWMLESADPKDGDKALVLFESPGDIEGTALLSYSHIGEPDDQWLFLPALKRVKRISSSTKSGPFVGSEFAYEDMLSQEVAKYRHRWLRDEPCGELQCFVTERVPAYDDSGYSRQVVWIDKVHYRPMRIDFFDHKGDSLKTLLYKDYRKYLDRYWRAHELVMQNHQSGKSTALMVSSYAFQTGQRAVDFTPDRLNRIR
jgi:hypothetical protein